MPSSSPQRRADALSAPYLGLYISCTLEFRQRFSAIDKKVLKNRQDDIRHYFNLIVLRELASVFVALEQENQLLDADFGAFLNFLKTHANELNINDEFNGSTEVEAEITNAIYEARLSILNGSALVSRTTQGFVGDVAEFVSSRISLFVGKTLYLFVDDYTELKVPREAQDALNHILFVPNSQYKCKVSSEVFGLTHDETVGSFLEKDREYRE